MRKKIVGLDEVKKMVDEFVGQNTELMAGIDFVVGVSRGGLVPAALLAARIDKPLVAAYINKNDEIFFDRADWIKRKQVLVVDDVIRSGKTLRLLKNHLENNCNPARADFFTLFRVVPLADKTRGISAISQEVNNDVIFPWD
jgi:hypoxanthine phosphoribosyltransferase